MKKRKIIFILITSILIYLLYWVLEPFSIIPFNQTPDSLAKIEQHLNCSISNKFDENSKDLINSSISKSDVLGISIAVYDSECGTWLSTAGYSNKRSKEKPNKTSLFRIASISKSMTAVGILQLYEKGNLDLDLPIQNYLPEFPKKKEGDITIRQLLRHTSGIPHYKSKAGIFNYSHYNSCIEAIDKFKNRELDFQPGSSFSYSSFGYTLLGAIIERISGMTYQEYMQKYIWKPSGMTHTNVEDKDSNYENKPDLYVKVGSLFIRLPTNDLSYTYSGGGIISTSSDLLLFGEAVLSYQLINPSTTEMMIKLSSEILDQKEYTYGWDSWISSKYGKIIEHNGAQLGASSFFRIYFDKKIVVAVLSNNLNSSETTRNLSIEIASNLLETKAMK